MRKPFEVPKHASEGMPRIRRGPKPVSEEVTSLTDGEAAVVLIEGDEVERWARHFDALQLGSAGGAGEEGRCGADEVEVRTSQANKQGVV